MENSITIRTAREEDAEELLKIYEPYVGETAVTLEYKVPEVEEGTARIRKTLCRYPYLVAMQGEDIVGYTYASPFHERKAYDWAVEVSVYVKRDKRKLGIGRKLYQALESELKKMNIVNVNACGWRSISGNIWRISRKWLLFVLSGMADKLLFMCLGVLRTQRRK